MYLHIGNGKSLKKKEIIGIFDLDAATVTRAGKDFINKKERSGAVEYESYDLPRSFILVDDGEGGRVYLSRISSQGLRLRIQNKEND